jgi:hypothetical protein
MTDTFFDINTLISISEEAKKHNEKIAKDKLERFEKRRLEKKEELFKFLTDKYHSIIRRAILQAAHSGKREKYINFNKNDFKANFPTLGYPYEIQKIWLDEVITNPSSDILPRHNENDMPIHFSGLNYDIWNNSSFTTHFTW